MLFAATFMGGSVTKRPRRSARQSVPPAAERHDAGDSPASFFDPPSTDSRNAAGPRPAAFSFNPEQDLQEARMTKRVARKNERRAQAQAAREESRARLKVVDGGWSPTLNEAPREQGYLKTLKAKSKGQQALLDAMDQDNLVVALGPAGTGKTYLAIAKAVEALEAGKVGRIVLSRPAVEAGESLGFLPGAMEDKLAPYLRPLYDALSDRLNPKRLKAMMAEGQIEIAPVGFMRGRTLNNAFVVIDEAQNCTYGQIKMLLTRLGWHSTMVVTGDPAQTDLLPEMSGLALAAERLSNLRGVSVVRLADQDIVRHPLVASMLTVL
jgi:phosphate starvation-inducible PhoH-like protein